MNVFQARYLSISLVKRAIGNPDLMWRNTYEARVNFPGASIETYLSMLTALCVAESQLHHSYVEYVRATCSTWEEDDTPYDPESFIVKEIGAGEIVGQRAISGDVLSASTVLSVKKAVQSGHSGRIFYRGCLTEQDVTTNNALISTLLPTVKASLNDALEIFLLSFNSEIFDLGGVSSGMALLGKINPTTGDPQNERLVLGLEARGPASRQLNNAYFDVGPA